MSQAENENQNQTYSIELKPDQYRFLEAMARTYGMADASKAARCLINHAIEREDRRGEIFEEIRCRHC